MWFSAKGAKGGLNPVFFIFDPKTQKPNSAARPPLKSRRPYAKAGNQLVAGRKCLARSRGCRNFVGVSTLLRQHFQPITANSSSGHTQLFVARQPSRWRPAQPRPPAAPCRRGLPPPRPSAWMGPYFRAPRSAKSAATLVAEFLPLHTRICRERPAPLQAHPG